MVTVQKRSIINPENGVILIVVFINVDVRTPFIGLRDF